MLTTAMLLTALLLLPQAAASPAPAAPAKTAAVPLTMTGCIDAKRSATGAIRFMDKATGRAYHLTGRGLTRYLGQQVEIVGGRRRGFSIRGGLWPSPNAAAQAGALDPAQESIARQPGGGGAGVGPALQEFPVARVRALTGSCR